MLHFSPSSNFPTNYLPILSLFLFLSFFPSTQLSLTSSSRPPPPLVIVSPQICSPPFSVLSSQHTSTFFSLFLLLFFHHSLCHGPLPFFLLYFLSFPPCFLLFLPPFFSCFPFLLIFLFLLFYFFHFQHPIPQSLAIFSFIFSPFSPRFLRFAPFSLFISFFSFFYFFYFNILCHSPLPFSPFLLISLFPSHAMLHSSSTPHFPSNSAPPPPCMSLFLSLDSASFLGPLFPHSSSLCFSSCHSTPSSVLLYFLFTLLHACGSSPLFLSRSNFSFTLFFFLSLCSASLLVSLFPHSS